MSKREFIYHVLRGLLTAAASASLLMLFACLKGEDLAGGRMGTENTISAATPDGNPAALARVTVRSAYYRPDSVPLDPDFRVGSVLAELQTDSRGTVNVDIPDDDTVFIEIITSDSQYGNWMLASGDSLDQSQLLLSPLGGLIVKWFGQTQPAYQVWAGFPGTPYYSQMVWMDSSVFHPVPAGLHSLELRLDSGQAIIETAFVDSVLLDIANPGETRTLNLAINEMITKMISTPAPCRFTMDSQGGLQRDSTQALACRE